MRYRSPKLNPPRKKDWKPGTFQVGLFIRTPEGATIEGVWDNADRRAQEAAFALLSDKVPVQKVLAEYEKMAQASTNAGSGQAGSDKPQETQEVAPPAKPDGT